MRQRLQRAWGIQSFALGTALVSAALLLEGCNQTDVLPSNVTSPTSSAAPQSTSVNHSPVTIAKDQPRGLRAPTSDSGHEIVKLPLEKEDPSGFEYIAIIYKTRYVLGLRKAGLDVEKRIVDAQYFFDVASLTTFLCNEDKNLISVQVEVRRYASQETKVAFATTGLFAAECGRVDPRNPPVNGPHSDDI